MPATNHDPAKLQGSYGHQSIVVKFKDNVALPYVDKVEAHFPKQKLQGWEAVLKLAPGSTFRRVFQQLEAKDFHALMTKVSDKMKQPPHLLQNFVLASPPGSPLREIVQVLHQWPEVERAYIAPLAKDPAPVNPLDDTRYTLQFYLQPAPKGIDAIYAWKQAGGDGDQQAVIDLEQGWTLDHEDLLDGNGQPRAKLLYGTQVAASNWHGTSVLGILCASDNSTGIVGIAPAVTRVDVVSHSGNSATIPDAIVAAVKALSPGGNIINFQPGSVLLLEVSLLEGGRELPAEMDPLVFETIQIISQLGVVVIEAAGNGATPPQNGTPGAGNLDDYVDFKRDLVGRRIFDRKHRDFLESNAIMVGAGRLSNQPAPHTPWTRALSSNYGSRIDCFGWGHLVVTTTSSPTNRTQAYTDQFGGTSAAAAIVAGAALCLQGMALQQLGRRLLPSEVRQYMSYSGPNPNPASPANTPTIDPARDKIGVMPNLSYIGTQWLGLPLPQPIA